MGTIVSPATWALGAARTGRQLLATLPVPGWAERLRAGSLWLPGSSASFGGAGTRPRGAPTEGTCAAGLRPAGGRVPGERGDRPRPAPASRVPRPRPHSTHPGSLAGAAAGLTICARASPSTWRSSRRLRGAAAAAMAGGGARRTGARVHARPGPQRLRVRRRRLLSDGAGRAA